MDLNDTSSYHDLCGYTEDTNLYRFLFVTVASVMALIGVLGNLLLVYVFITKSKKNTPPALYPITLAVYDAVLCVLYVLLFGIDQFMLYIKLESLFIIYHIYIVPAFVVVKYTQLMIPYLLIFVTLERYAWISKHTFNEWFFTNTGRVVILTVVSLAVAIIRLPPAFALTVQTFPDCKDFFRTLAVSMQEWAMESEWYNFYDFYLIGFLQMVIPFLILIALNFVIVKRLLFEERRRSKRSAPVILALQTDENQRPGSFRVIKNALKRPTISLNVRNAVHTTAIIVTSYLICSGLQLVLTALEKTDASILKSEDDSTKASIFYTVFGDMISFLYMFTSAIRILIYCKCNPAVRENVMQVLEIYPKGLKNRLSYDFVLPRPVTI